MERWPRSTWSDTLAHMRHQFRHEHHNRSDKIFNPEYKDDFAKGYDPGGSDDLRLHYFDVFSPKVFYRKEAHHLKPGCLDFVERTLRSTKVRAGRYILKFSCDVEEFARMNKIQPEKA